MRLRNILVVSLLAISASLTGCGNNDKPLTDAQMQRRAQELQLQAQQQQVDAQRQQQRLDLESQRLQNQAMNNQLNPQYNQAGVPVQYNQAGVPVQQSSSGIGTGTAVLGAAAVGAAGYMLGKSNSTSSSSRDYIPPAPPSRTYAAPAYVAPKSTYTAPAYVAPKSTYSAPAVKRTATVTRFSSTKR